MDLIYKQGWSNTGAAGALTAIEVAPAAYSVFSIDCSTLATTNSVTLQSAQFSSGPWFIEASTAISTAASTMYVMHITGPLGPWVRPVLNTAATGAYDLLLFGVG